jgi:hypothetical protein
MLAGYNGIFFLSLSPSLVSDLYVEFARKATKIESYYDVP